MINIRALALYTSKMLYSITKNYSDLIHVNYLNIICKNVKIQANLMHIGPCIILIVEE